MVKENKRKLFEEKRIEFLKSFENSKIPWISYIFFLLIILLLRNIIESFSTKNLMSDYITFLHYNLFFVGLLLFFGIVFFVITKIKPEKLLKLLIPFFSLILVAPIIDLITTFGKGTCISYLTANSFFEMNLLTFLIPLSSNSCGVSIGIFFEIFLMLALSFIYFIIKTKSLLKSAFGFVLLYLGFFIFLYEMVFLNFLFSLININFLELTRYQINFLLLLLNLFYSLLFLIILFYLHNKNYFKIIFSDFRFFRLFHFTLMLFFGAMLFSKNVFFELSFNLLNLFICFFAIVFAWGFCVIQNNLVDKKIDNVSNKLRPLQMGVNEVFYKKLSYMFLFLALLFSLIVGFFPLIIIISFIGVYQLYSSKITRFKKIPIFSKLFISFNSLLLILLGYYIFVGNNVLEVFPEDISFIFLFGFTLALNFIDIKDYKGDKLEKINTLPVLFGLKKSKIIIGIFFGINYLIAFFILKKEFLLLPILLLALIQFFLITRKNYDEKLVFIVYFISVFLFSYFY